ncbi:MAG: hypothetical protein FWF03_07520, partial [Defluviitaleaceae bacterium]|nr:hypothetical protein [Defluviitaleaceae bacterium]
VSTFAGLGAFGSTDGSAPLFYLPCGITGNGKDIYVADTYNNLIRMISESGSASRVAGSILGLDEYRFPKGYYRDGKLEAALFNRPADLAISPNGRLFIADGGNNSIRYVSGSNVYTFAGGLAGHRDGRAGEARFCGPQAIAFDSKGNLYVADTLNDCVRKIDPKGLVTTIAGVPGSPGYADGAAGASKFRQPMGIAVTRDGSRVYVSDTGNHAIRVLEKGRVRTLAGITHETDEDGDPVGDFADGKASEAMFNLPMKIELVGNILVVADYANNRIRAVTGDGTVVTLAGTGDPGSEDGPALLATFNQPSAVYAAAGYLYVADTNNCQIRRMPLDGKIFR